MHNKTDIKQSSLLPLSSTAVSVESSLEEANSSGVLSFLGFCIAMIGFGVTFSWVVELLRRGLSHKRYGQ
jgi:hypothetical protein